MLQGGRSPVRVPDEIDFFNLRNPSSRTMALGSTQPLSGISTRNLPGGKKRLTNLQPSMSLMSENVGASNTRNRKGLQGLYRTSFTFFILLLLLLLYFPLPYAFEILTKFWLILYYVLNKINRLQLMNCKCIYVLRDYREISCNLKDFEILLPFNCFS
jgi:hypothetical protein